MTGDILPCAERIANVGSSVCCLRTRDLGCLALVASIFEAVAICGNVGGGGVMQYVLCE